MLEKIINNKVKIIAFLIFVIAPSLLSKDDFYAGILFQTLLWAGMSGTWNLLGGYAGQFSLGHAAFFGIGAYTSSLLASGLHLTPWLGMLAGASLSAMVGVILGAICFRLRGHFFSLATLAFGQIVYIIALSWRSVTNGSEGVLIMSSPGWSEMAFNSKMAYVYLALIYMLIVVGVSFYLDRSRLGYFLVAYRENDEAARAIGVNTFLARVIVSGISAFLMAAGGTLYAQYMYYIDPDSVLSIALSVQAPLIAIVGGLGGALGPVFGSFLILPMTQMLRAWLGTSFSGLHLIIYGVILIVVLLLIPEGIFPKLTEYLKKRTEKENSKC
ncbi:MAG: hypothetical protein AWM53_01475 [Candidatus Dichloromethanomonas elyunquensis]|nr:MAG: hypothetical protein AWM53_01475 [Candidatus Dichloromethanomonas elyunquensis]